MGNLTTLAKSLEAKEKADAMKRYVELLEKGNDAEALLKAGKALGRSAADIEREQMWLHKVRAQEGGIANGKGLRDQEAALEQKIVELTAQIKDEITRLRIPLLELQGQLADLQARYNAASWASQALEKFKYENLELTEALGMQLPHGVSPRR